MFGDRGAVFELNIKSYLQFFVALLALNVSVLAVNLFFKGCFEAFLMAEIVALAHRNTLLMGEVFIALTAFLP